MELKSRHYNFIMNHHEFNTFLTFKFVWQVISNKLRLTQSVARLSMSEMRQGVVGLSLSEKFVIYCYQDNFNYW